MRLALAALALAACDSSPPAPMPMRPPAAEAVAGREPLEIHLSLTANNAPLREVATTLSEQTGQSVIIGSQVEPVADCLHLTILNPSPVPASRIIEQVRTALASSGVTLEVGESELRFVAAEGADPSCPRPPVAELPSGGASRAAPPAFAQGVRKVGDTQWTITQAAVEALTQPDMTRSARVIPHQEDGVVIGMKLYGIRRSSPLGLLGIQNGDMVRTINGHDMSNPTAALEAYGAIRGADRIVVSIVRRGHPRTHTYRITD